MSHEGFQATGSGPWPPNAQYNQQLFQPSPPIAPGRTQVPHQPGNGTGAQLWNQNAHLRNGASTAHPLSYPEPSQPIQPQYIQPQTLHPGQLTKHPVPTPYQQHAPRSLAIPQSRRISALSSVGFGSPGEPDRSLLLISLAEEYIQAAHKLAPSLATNTDSKHIEEYQKLVATALACFDATLKKTRPQPRVEANVRLRYASLLYEETTNFTEAELNLSKGIKLCEMYNYHDLKYAMQFLMAQLMFENNPKAAMKALDSHISDAEAYRHTSWIYALRFLRASFALASGTAADTNVAVQNFKTVAEMAIHQGDRAIHRLASLVEAMVHLKSTTLESLENADRCMAAAWTYQLDTDQTAQLRGLTHIVDLACSLRHNKPRVIAQKCKEMQITMDEILKSHAWGPRDDLFSIPINSTMRDDISTVSYDTRMILGIGEDGRDALMMSFLSQRDTYAICSLLSGIFFSHNSATDGKCFNYYKHGLTHLEPEKTRNRELGASLATHVAKQKWRGKIKCLLHASIAMTKAQTSDWVEVRKCLDELEKIIKHHELSMEDSLGSLALYLRAIYYQGTGHLEEALGIYQDPRFGLPAIRPSGFGCDKRMQHDLSILSALNTLWILQHSSYKVLDRNTALLARLAPHCESHTDPDFRTAYRILQASVPSNVPLQIHITKNFLSAAFNGSQATANTHFLCLTFSIMCGCFYATNVGEQAEKSALAAQMQAKRSGNKLWGSVTDGLLAKCYEGQGKMAEADGAFREGVRLAEEAMRDG